jgi:flagellar biosynthetic protein FliP
MRPLSQRERETAHGGAAVVLARSGEGLQCQPAPTLTPHPFAQDRSPDGSRALKPSPAGRGIFCVPTRAELLRALKLSALATLICLAWPIAAFAQDAAAAAASGSAINIDLGTGAGLTERVVQLVGLMTVLSLAPSIVIMTTSFVRIVVVLSLLRTALGMQQSPPNAVLVSLALFLSAIVMAPTWQDAYDSGIRPLMDQEMELPQAFDLASEPVKDFMLAQVEPEDLALFTRLSQLETAVEPSDLPLRVIIPAFMISELKRAFVIGFLLFVPFLVIDLVVASVLMSMGMMMLPPVVISLPFKLIFFVLVDGWRLVAGSLVESFRQASGTG